jgi:hypothetical protein
MSWAVGVLTYIQYNSFKMSPVKMFSHLRCKDKKAPNSPIWLTLHFALSPPKKIFCLRSNKFDDKTVFFLQSLVHFLYQNLKQFPRVSVGCVSKIQCSNGMVSSCMLISKVISASFTQQNDATSWCGGVIFLPRCRDCSQLVPTTQSLWRWLKDCIRGVGSLS